MLDVVGGCRTTILYNNNTTITIRCMCMNFILMNKVTFLHESTIVYAAQAGANGMLITCMLVEILHLEVMRECLVIALRRHTVV